MTEIQGRRQSRRRFIAIAGVTAGCAVMPGLARSAVPIHRWRGTALGASASIQLVHPDEAAARQLIDRAVSEIVRLERIFSLFHDDSALSRLNRDGVLSKPPFELLELLTRAAAVSAQTHGAFDVTIQPLWLRYRDYFRRIGHASQIPDVDDVLQLVNWRLIDIEPAAIRFCRPGMAVTLNGIAQGFITDRVAALLRRDGIEHVLLDLGEVQALGDHPAGRPWRVGIADPAGGAMPVDRLALIDRALATSGGYGLQFDKAGQFSHLIDPRTGATAPVTRGVTVTSTDATTADAYSTAFALMNDDQIADIVRRLSDLEAYSSFGRGLHRVTV